jgi:hypothetical protein
MSKKKNVQTEAQTVVELFSEDGNGSAVNILRGLQRFDVTNATLQAFQSDNARRFRLSIVDKNGERKSWKIETGRSVAEVEELFTLLSPAGALILTSALMLQSVLREALQASVLLDNMETLRAELATLPEGTRIEYEALKAHEDGSTERPIVIDSTTIKLIELVASACAARYEYTEDALPTRARTKRAHSVGRVKIESS